MQECELLKKAEEGRGRELGWPDSHCLGILWELEPLEDWSVSLTTCR